MSSRPPEFIDYDLTEKFGGKATATYVQEDRGYTVIFHDMGERGSITREKMPLDRALKAEKLVEEGKYANAALILAPILAR